MSWSVRSISYCLLIGKISFMIDNYNYYYNYNHYQLTFRPNPRWLVWSSSAWCARAAQLSLKTSSDIVTLEEWLSWICAETSDWFINDTQQVSGRVRYSVALSYNVPWQGFRRKTKQRKLNGKMNNNKLNWKYEEIKFNLCDDEIFNWPSAAIQ